MSDPMHIPTDVWLHVAKFIPDDTLQNMLGVNCLFFDLAMDVRYKEVSMKSICPTTMRTIARLTDPFVARRVKRVHLRLNHLERWLNHPASRRESPMSSKLWRRFQTTLHLPCFSHPVLESWLLAAPCTPASFEGLVKGLTIILPGLVNVVEFSIDSWNWPPEFDLAPFFSAAWSGFGKTVRKVSLGGNLEGFKELITSKPQFDSVEELDLEFTNNLSRSPSDPVDDEAILFYYVAPFISSVSTHLQSLRIWSWASADLSTFFQHLGPFPALRSFGVRAAFNRSFRDDPSGLTQLLRSTAPTLRELELRLNPSGVVSSETTHDLLLCEWLSQTIMSDDTIAAGLQTLQFYPTASAGGCDVLLDCVKRSGDTLKQLLVRDRYLHYEEIERLTEAFSSHAGLTYLRLNVWRLTADLVDLLAKNFTSLEKLTLNVADAVTGQHDFEEQMQTRCFVTWKLRDIDIWQNGSELDNITMHLIAKSIPSVHSFWGTGHMGKENTKANRNAVAQI